MNMYRQMQCSLSEDLRGTTLDDNDEVTNETENLRAGMGLLFYVIEIHTLCMSKKCGSSRPWSRIIQTVSESA